MEWNLKVYQRPDTRKEQNRNILEIIRDHELEIRELKETVAALERRLDTQFDQICDLINDKEDRE